MAFVVIAFIGMVLMGIKKKRVTGCEECVIDLQQSKCLKGICAVEIALGHIGLIVDSPYLFPFRKAGILVVGIFFFLSGYGLNIKLKTSHASFGKYIVNKITVLIMSLLITNAIYVIVEILCFHREYVPYEMIGAILGIGLVNYPSWYLYELIVLYIFFGIIAKYAAKHAMQILTVVIAIGSGAGFLWGIGSPWYGSAFCFVLGILCNCKESKLKELFATSLSRYCWTLMVLVITMATGMLGFFVLGEESFLGDVFCRNIASVSFSCLLYLLLLKWEFKGKLYEWMSSLAMYIYLYHMLMINILYQIKVVSNNSVFYTITVLAGSILLAQMIVIAKKSMRKVWGHGKG